MLLVLTKTEMKTKSSCSSDGSVTLANGFFGVELYQFGTCLGISSNYIWWGIAFISWPIFSFTMTWCLLQFANSKHHVNGRFYKSIIRVHWISRQAYSVRKNPDIRLITVLRRWYLFISPAVGRKYIARISLRRFPTTADSEYIFSLQPVI